MRRLLRACAGVLAVVVVGACAGVAPLHGPPASVLEGRPFGDPVAPLTRQEIFTLSPQMRRWLAVDAAAALHSRGPQRGLFDALFGHGRLRLDYDGARTRTAAEAFADRAGNCLSLVVLTAAFARELGLEVRFQEIEGAQAWERRSTIDFAIGHVNLAIGRVVSLQGLGLHSESWMTVDFEPVPEGGHALVTVVDESRIVAMVHNNRAAEALASGRLAEAFAHARAAVTVDPEFAHAYNTLGVVWRQQGDLDRAQAALQHAVAIDVRHVGAMANLAGLYEARGAAGDAQAWRERARRVMPREPLREFDEGLRALAAGDARAARQRLERARRQGVVGHELHFALARSHSMLGDQEQARAHLEQAHELSHDPQRRALYAAKIAGLDRLRSPSP